MEIKDIFYIVWMVLTFIWAIAVNLSLKQLEVHVKDLEYIVGCVLRRRPSGREGYTEHSNEDS